MRKATKNEMVESLKLKYEMCKTYDWMHWYFEDENGFEKTDSTFHSDMVLYGMLLEEFGYDTLELDMKAIDTAYDVIHGVSFLDGMDILNHYFKELQNEIYRK